MVESFHPEIACPDNTSHYTASSTCSYTVSDTGFDAVFTSATIIPGRTLTHDFATAPVNSTLDGAAFPKGTTTVTWTARQTIGGIEYTGSCSHTITVIDNVAPVIVTPFADVTANITPSACVNNTLVLTPPTATDNCTAAGSIVITSNAPSTFLLGTTNVRWTFRDESGNTSTYDQKVTIIDNEGPVITGCEAPAPVQASGGDCKAVVTWPQLVATDDCSGVASFSSNYTSGSLFPVGPTVVTYTAIDKAVPPNTTTCSFTVVVTDALPMITCVTDKTRNTNSGLCSYQVMGNELDPTVFGDNCGVKSLIWSYTDKVTGDPVTGSNTLSGAVINRGFGLGATGIVPITWTVTDLNDQTASCTFNLTIEDHEGPLIIVPGNAIRNTDLNQNFYTVIGDEFDYVETNDNCGIVVKKVNNLLLNTFAGLKLPVGVNTITWYAEDDKGNSSAQSFTITILDAETPRLVEAVTGSTASATGSCEATVNYSEPTFIDNVTATGSLVVTISPIWAVSGATFPVGTTVVTYMVVDGAGNSFDYTFNVVVSDTQNPTITCPSGSPFNRNTDAGSPFYSAQGTEFNPSYSDNCSVSVSNNYNSSSSLAGATFPVGTTTVIWTARDASSNTANCSIDVVITDNQVPAIAHCPVATVSENSDLGYCSFEIPGAEYDPYGFSDNNALLKLTYQIGAGTEVGTDLTTTLAGVLIPVGTAGSPTTTITWRLYDQSSNISATCQTIFTIADPEPPIVLTTTNQIRHTDAGQDDYTVNGTDDWDPIVTDNCDVATVTYQIDGGDIIGTDPATTILGQAFAVGTHTVLWTATDIHGNTSTGSYQVTVTDDELPAAACNDITVNLDATGNYILTPEDIAAIGLGSSDENGPITMTVTPNVFDCSNVGENSVLLTVTDAYGNESTCNTSVVTVVDVTPPDAVCQAVTLYLDVNGEATVAATSVNNGSSDACGIAGYQISKDNSTFTSTLIYGCSEVGISNSIYLKVTDNNGNSTVCSTTATVVDDFDPVAVCNPITVFLDATGNYTLTQANKDAIALGSADNCLSDLLKIVNPNTFNCTDIGANTVTLQVVDPAGNHDECTTTVTVRDNLAPVAICQDITIQLDASGSATITPAQLNNGSTDNCDATPTLAIDKSTFACADKGTNTVTLTVTDDYGNFDTCTATVTVEDHVNPEITCTSNQTVSTDNNQCTYTHTGADWDALASDGCTAINSLIYALTGDTELASNPANTSLNNQVFNKGTTTVTWSATDASGNSTGCSFDVTVNDTELPTALCKVATVQLDATGNVALASSAVDNGSADNCGIPVLSVSPSAFTCANLGANTVTLTVTDGSGNTNTCQTTVTVEDNIDPVAVCQNITVQLDATGNMTVNGPDIDSDLTPSSDNCSIASYLVSKNNITFSTSVPYSCSDVAAGQTLYFKVTDPAGNESTVCTATVTVEDKVLPTAICKDITLQLDAAGQATLAAAEINNGSGDACGILSLVASQTAFTCTDLGTNTVTLTVTDNNGNVATCDATVTIQDQVSPSFGITCPGNKTPVTGTDPGVCTYTHPDDTWNPAATDNCAVSSLTYSVSAPSTLTAPNTTLNGQVFAKGVTTVTWTATDASGNSNTCVFTVTVTDDQSPTASCKTAAVQLDRSGNVTVLPAVIDNASYDNCGIITYRIKKNLSDSFTSSVSYNCSEIGDHTVYLEVTDAAGQGAGCSTTITIQDTQGPALDDLTVRLVNTGSGGCTYTHADTSWDPTDNCGTVTSMVYTLTGATETTGTDMASLNGVVFSKGTTHVSWSATDNHGNTTTTEFDVTVSDDQNPTIACQANLIKSVINAGDSSRDISLADGLTPPTHSDNCAVTQLSWSMTGAGVVSPGTLTGTVSNPTSGVTNPLDGFDFKLGTTTVNYTARDEAGRTSTCSFTITINAITNGAVTVTGGPILTYEDQSVAAATFTVALPTAPTGNVCIDATTNDNSEGLLNTTNNRSGAASAQTVCFNTINWNVPQTIYVFGVDDDVDDDDIGYMVELTINTGLTDDLSGYENVNPDDVLVTNVDNDVAAITVTPIDVSTSETGETGTFTVVLNTKPTHEVTITLTSSDLTEGDVTNPVLKTLTFTPENWSTAQTVTVTGADELIDDGDISYTIISSDATSTDPKYNNMAVDDVSMTNVDNDTAGITVTPLTLNTTEASGAGHTATFTVVLNTMPATDLDEYDVYVGIASNDLTEGTVNLSQLYFNAFNWDTPQYVTVTAVDEDLVDGDIVFTIVNTVNSGLTTDPNYDPLDPADVSVINADDDAATVSINSINILEGSSVPGTTTFEFTVTHAGDEVIGGYTVSYYTSNGTGKSPTDFTGTGGTLTFTGTIGETKTVTVLANQDMMVEPNELFYAVLNRVTAPGKDVTILPAGKTGTGTILNDDSSTLSINDVSITEGNSGTKLLNFTVSLTNPVELGVKVDYATADLTPVASAIAGEDYVAASGTLTFTGTAGETKTISVTINGDEKVELHETFHILLSNPRLANDNADTNISIADATGVGTISNDDEATVSIDNVQHTESNSGTVSYVFTVTLSKTSDAIVTVDYASADGDAAIADADYSAVSGTLTFNPGVTTQNITVQVNGDTKVEPDEVFTIGLTNLVNTSRTTITLGTATGTGTVTNDDSASLSINDVTVNEDAGTATFTVTLAGTVQNNFTVNYATANNTAVSTSSSDFTAIASTTLTFGGSNSNTQTITASITNDIVAEAIETYFINLSGLVSNSQSGLSISDTQGVGTITDNDPATIALSGFVVTETNSTQTANFLATMSITAQHNVVFTYTTTNGTAGSSDFTAQNAVSYTILAGNTTVNIPVSVKGDLIAEPTEEFTGTIAMSNANGQQVTIPVIDNTSTGRILDNDVITINLTGFTVTETNGTQIQNFRASMNTTAQHDIVLSFSTADGTALNSSDYTALTAISVTIPAGSLYVDIPVDVLGDQFIEPQELLTGTITLTNDGNQQATVGTATANGVINDNDAASIAIGDVTVDEAAGTATFTVTLTGNIQDAFSVDYTTSNNSPTASALAASDYSLSTGTLTFTAGSTNNTTRTFTVPITDDIYTEPTETYTVTLSGITGGPVTISDPAAIGTITDNDAVSIAINDVTVAEDVASHTAVFTVTLTGNVQDALTVHYTTADGAAANPAVSPSDYTTTTGTVTFPAGSLSTATQSITIPIIDNAITEPTSEYYTVDLSDITCTGSASFTGGDSQGLGTITDDDPLNHITLTGFTVTEGDATLPHNFVASLDYITQEPVVISFTTTPGTALHGSDITAQTIVQYTILPGNLSVNIPVAVIGDLVTEPTESFTGTLVDINDQLITIGTATATGTINDNDQATFTITGFTRNEADGTGTFTIATDKVVQNAITVDFYTADHTALALSDYTAKTATTLNFGAGNPQSQTVDITLTNDDLVEPTEELYGIIANLVPNSQNVILYGSGATTSATGIIQDNEEAKIAINNTNVTESAGVTATFTVTLTGNIQDALTINYTTTGGSALASGDYTTTTGTLTFVAGSVSGTTLEIVVPIVNDDIAEPSENYTVDLSNIVCTGQNSFTENQGSGTILDNDVATISLADFSIQETSSTQTAYFRATMTIAAQEDVVLTFNTTNGTAGASDFTGQTGTTVTITHGSTYVDIPVSILGDGIAEPTEYMNGTIVMTTDNGQQVTVPSAGGTATGTITDMNAALILLTGFRVSEINGTQQQNFVVTMSKKAEKDIALIFHTTAGTAAANSDYIPHLGTSVVILAGTTSALIPVEILGDLISEPSESFTGTIQIVNTNSQAVQIITASATAEIQDDDIADLVIIQSATPNPVIAGQNLAYTLTVRNEGTNIATNVSINEVLPTGLTLVSSTPSKGSWTASVWSLGSLAVGESANLVLVASVPVNQCSAIVNNVSVSSSTTDPDHSNNTSAITTGIIDRTAPTFTVPADITIYKDANCGYNATVGVTGDATSEADNCTTGIQATFSDVLTSGECAGKQIIIRTWSLRDNSGNTTNHVQTITVIDNTAPLITCPVSPQTRTITGLADYYTTMGSEFDCVILADNCSTARTMNNLNGLSTLAGYTFPIGSTIVTWNSIDACGNLSQCSFTVIIDASAITITSPPPVTAFANEGCTATGVILGTPGTEDNCGVKSITNDAPQVFPLGVTSVTWTVTNNCGVTVTCTQSVCIQDDTPPSIICLAPVTAFTNDGCTAINIILGSPDTGDNCGVESVTNNAPAVFPLGITNVIWTVTDNSDNTATCAQTVTVLGAVVATNDNGSVTNGWTGGSSLTNVLSNDHLSCQEGDLGEVNLFMVSISNPKVTLVGQDVVVAPGTPAGIYYLTYQVCLKSQPFNCDQATVTVPVSAPVIKAAADHGMIHGLVGGMVINNVLANDSLNGELADTTNVILSFVSSSHPKITLNGSDIFVAPLTPAGIYTLDYRICDVVNPDNCAQATATVTVSAGIRSGMAITKTAIENSFSSEGEVIHYSIEVRNLSEETIFNIFVADSNAVITTGNPVAMLGPGMSTILLAHHIVNQEDIDAGQIMTVASANGSYYDGIPTTKSGASITVDGLQRPQLTATKFATETAYWAVGEIIHYTIEVFNCGNVTARNIWVTDPTAAVITGNPVSSLAPRHTVSFTAEHVVTQADVDAGKIVNVAYAAGIDPTGQPVGDESNMVTLYMNQPSKLVVTKFAEEPSFEAIGDTIHYSIFIKNYRSTMVSDIVVIDPNATIISGTPIFRLASGKTEIVRAFHIINQKDLDAGKVINVATARGRDLNEFVDKATSNEVTVFAKQNPMLVITKSAEEISYSKAGDIIHYNNQIENTGNVAITGISLSDPYTNSSESYQVDTLRPGETVSIKSTHFVTQADLNIGYVEKTASVTGKGPNSQPIRMTSNQVIVRSTQQAQFSATITAAEDTYGLPGETIHYSIEVRNTGNAITGIPPGDAVIITAEHLVTQTDLLAGRIVSSVVTTGYHPNGNPISIRSNECTILANKAEGLAVTAVVQEAQYSRVGEIIHFKITVKNHGKVPVSGITVTASDAVITGNPEISTLPASGFETMTALHVVTQSDLDKGLIKNLASITGTYPDRTQFSEKSNWVRTYALKNPQLTTKFSAAESQFQAEGDQIHYSITLTNTGNLSVSGIVLTSHGELTITDKPDLNLAPGNSVTLSAVYTVDIADLDAGKVVRAVNASGKALDQQPISTTGNEVSVMALQKPELTTLASALETSFSIVGEVIHYRIMVKNSGNVSIVSTAVTDPNAVIVTVRPITILAPNDSVIITAEHSITQADLDAGKVVSEATAAGFDLKGQTIEKKGNTVTVMGIQNHEMTVSNIASQLSFKKTGEVIHYNIKVSNSGNVSLFNIGVIDPVLLMQAGEPVATLAPGQHVSIAGTHTVTQADLDAGKVTSIVKANGADSKGKQIEKLGNTVTLTAEQKFEMAATTVTSASTYKQEGDVIGFTVIVTNTGNVTMSDISISDEKVLLNFSTSIASLAPGQTDSVSAEYRITAEDVNAGKVVTAGIAEGSAPSSDRLSYMSDEVILRLLVENYNLNNFPNPFAYETTIVFDLPEKGEAILKVYDMAGREVGQIEQKDFSQGRNFVNWKTRSIQKGLYFLKMYYRDDIAVKIISIIN